MAEAPLVQRAYTTIVEHFVKTGRAPHYTELAEMMGLGVEEARDLQREAAAPVGFGLFVEGTDYIRSWSPFSNVPTHHLLTVEGEQKWYGV
jgi:hypothetical protein